MTRFLHSLAFLAALAVLAVGLASCATTQPQNQPQKPAHETAGEYIDDSVVTAKVKAAILNDPALKSFQISVETMKGTVQLSGFVDSAHAVRRAGEVALAVRGATSVRNDLIVK
jgi:osmotically-inducible protein OsmY